MSNKIKKLMSDGTSRLRRGMSDGLHPDTGYTSQGQDNNPVNTDMQAAATVPTAPYAEFINIAERAGITAHDLRKVERLLTMNKDTLNLLAALGPKGVSIIYSLGKDEPYIQTAKLNIFILINRLSKTTVLQYVLRKLGALIEVMKRIRELIFQ